MRLKLVENWRQGWKWFSSQAFAISITLTATWATIPEKLQDRINDQVAILVLLTILVSGFVGRFFDQQKLKKDMTHG